MGGSPAYTFPQDVQVVLSPQEWVKDTSCWTVYTCVEAPVGSCVFFSPACTPVPNTVPMFNTSTSTSSSYSYDPLLTRTFTLQSGDFVHSNVGTPASCMESVHSDATNVYFMQQDDCSQLCNMPSEFTCRDVWRLAKHARGCRFIQQALEDADSDGARSQIASELRGHVWEAINSPHANHVIQKCISTMRPCDSQFIVDEILQRGPGAAVEIAEHKYGCRILQRLLEHFPSDRMRNLIDDILAEAVTLCKHTYGNFFMHHLLEYGDENHVSELLQVLTHHAASIASDPAGVSVLAKALTHRHGDAQTALANALASQPRWLVTMSSLRHGYKAAELTLQTAAPSQRDIALAEIRRHRDRMIKSRYSKKLIAFVEKGLQEQL